MIPRERPVAEIKIVKLIDGKPNSFSMEVDYSAGWGSYAGPVTTFIEKGYLDFEADTDFTGDNLFPPRKF